VSVFSGEVHPLKSDCKFLRLIALPVAKQPLLVESGSIYPGSSAKSTVEISKGTINESVAHPREIFRSAIVHSAYALVLVHNHPSGDCTPSEADIRLTRRIAESARLLQINFLDHVIVDQPFVDRQGYFSFKETGLL
jgi:hypothetical protein